jgi:hypothetical protein
MRKIAALVLIPLVLLSSSLIQIAYAHWVFTFWFETYSINADHMGVYTVDMKITALYWKVGYIIKATWPSGAKPSNVIVMVMPPVGFFKETGSKNLKLMVMVLPGATKGAFQIWFDVTQIIPPYPTDKHTWTSGPILYIT